MPSTMRYKKVLFSIHLLMFLSTHFIIMTEPLPRSRHLDVAMPGQLGPCPAWEVTSEPAAEIPGLCGEGRAGRCRAMRGKRRRGGRPCPRVLGDARREPAGRESAAVGWGAIYRKG